MSIAPRVDIAGAGVFGLCIAVQLALAGARVRLFDPAALGDNASGVAAGMLAPVSEALTDPAAAPHLPLLMAAREVWPDFARTVGVSLDQQGAVLVGDQARLDALQARANAFDIKLEARTKAQLPALPTGWHSSVAGGIFTAQDWRIDASALTQLAKVAQDAGVGFVRESFNPGETDHHVLAGGLSAGLRRFAPELGLLSPVRGHILVCEGVAYHGPAVRGLGAYAAPSDVGLLIGATMEPGEATAEVSPAIADALAGQAVRTFPGLADLRWRAQAGVRAATPDGLPLVGPSAEGMLLAAGARRNGWLLGPLVGEMITAMIFGRDPGPWAESLAPDRFNAG
jgi:glycine oxidase